ncbi:required for meiotic nuclear division 5 protein souji isoform X2 [Oratosquilla oratoria]|uniref:required for meiotic nuclear division 5 protein souji isoform X2 n=1 Tax=Oratosquilla oratoria TaxID=337810 RepID=UPI003F764152
MDACTAVERDIDKVLSKFTAFSEHSSNTLTNLRSDIENLKREIDQVGSGELTEAQALILTQALGRVKEAVTCLSTDHRDLHSSVSKVGKAVDKNFTPDFGCISNDSVFSGTKQQLLNEVICQHFFRQGLLTIAEDLISETDLQLQKESREPFFELNRILDALKARKLEPALEWAKINREKLRAQHSSLEFKLHRLAFIELIKEGPHKVQEAIQYARLHFTPFVYQHEKVIQNLMGSLLYVKEGLVNSPYAELLSSTQWGEICDVFTRDACALLGLSVDSPLSVCINAGCTALPILLNIKQVMQQRQVHSMWNTKEELPVSLMDELPIEIDLGPTCRYHSIFACPILRQQSTESNPPMRLICGHVISRDALNKLTNGNKLKCPYCPVEQNPNEAAHIHF